MKKNILYSTIAFLLLLVSWLVAYFAIGNAYVLPSPLETAREGIALLAEPNFYVVFFQTVMRAVWAFLLSLVLGVFTALASHLNEACRGIFRFFISVIRTLPTMAIILILLLWTNPLVAPVIVAGTVLFPVCHQAILSALDEIGKEYADVAKAFRVPLLDRIFKMYLPLSAPPVLSQLGPTFSMGLKVVVSAEILSLTYQSLGGMMQEAKLYVQIPKLFALTLLAVLFGFLAEIAFQGIAKALTRWKQ